MLQTMVQIHKPSLKTRLAMPLLMSRMPTKSKFDYVLHLGPKVLSVVDNGRHMIFKSTLVLKLNGHPFLPKDHLTRVKHLMHFNNHDDYMMVATLSSTCLLKLGLGCGIYLLQCSSTIRTSIVKVVAKQNRGGQSLASKCASLNNILQGVDHGSLWIQRVLKMQRKIGTQWVYFDIQQICLIAQNNMNKKHYPMLNLRS